MPQTAAEQAARPSPDRASFWALGRFDQPKHYSAYYPGGPSTWLLMFTDTGAGIVEQGGSKLRTSAGDAVLLSPGYRQYYRTDPDVGRWRFWWVHFWMHAEWSGRIERFGRGDGIFLLPSVAPPAHADIDGSFRRAHAHARWTGEGPVPALSPSELPPAVLATTRIAQDLADGDIGQVLLLLSSNSSYSFTRVSGEDERVTRARALIRADPAGAHSVASLADAVALSPSRLAHLFREQTNMSVMQEVRHERLQRGASLLRTTAMPVAHVAAACGYSSPFHFSRAFSAAFDLPPRDYRRLVDLPRTRARARSGCD